MRLSRSTRNDMEPSLPSVARLTVDDVGNNAYWSSVSYGCCLSRGEPHTVKLSAAITL